ncbi:hypothetical protein D3C76_1598350 [compost metagenome]
MEGQAVAAVLNDTVHLLLKLTVQRGQAVTHVAVAAQLFDDHLVQRHPRFFQMLLSAVVDPRQLFAQCALVTEGLLALAVCQAQRLAIAGYIAIR